jgi:hypothetical protein
VLLGLARAHEGGEKSALLQQALDEHYPRPSLGTYYQALATLALGRSAEARALLDRLEETARRDAADCSNPRACAVGHYLLSLALREKGDGAGADTELAKARALDPHPDRRALTQAQIEYAGGHQ